jgi:hypothetical protein
MEDSGRIAELISALNNEINLPRNLPITFADCNEANAYYDPKSKQVIVCNQLAKESYTLFANDSDNSVDEALDHAVNTINFTILHEIGHAPIDICQLPVLGREEDVADSVAAILGLYLQGDPHIVTDAAIEFAAYAEMEDDNGGFDYSDVHSASGTRAFDLLCLVYGSNPDEYQDLVGEDGLPKERADLCSGEFNTKVKAWDTLFGKYMKV